MHTTKPRDLLHYEYLQRREAGYDVGGVTDWVEKVLQDTLTPDREILDAYEALLQTTVAPGWPYHEPNDLKAILSTLAPSSPVQPVGDLANKIHGAWLGRCAGCNLGKPIELGEYWTQTKIRNYLETVGAWPLADYIPALDPMPEGYELRECWPETTLGNIDGSARDDDVDYTILGLHLIEQHGSALSCDGVASEWLLRLPYMQTYTAERAAYRNVINNVAAQRAGEIHNPYREWIGAQIRGDAFGYVNPGDPRSAAIEAYQDATLSHRANGIYGEMWAAALVAAAFTAPDARAALRDSLNHIPPRSRLHEALSDVLGWFDDGKTWEEGRALIEERYGRYNWVHTVNNAALVAAGLLWGRGDFTSSICLTVIGGWDTDSNGATAGSVAGIFAGRDQIPHHWTAPLKDFVHSAVSGFDRTRISALAERTLAVIEKRVKK
jgi:ADP-ribosylglycohydrolase